MRSYDQIDGVLMLFVGSLLVGDLVMVFDGGIVVIFFMQVLLFTGCHYFTLEFDLWWLFALAILKELYFDHFGDGPAEEIGLL